MCSYMKVTVDTLTANCGKPSVCIVEWYDHHGDTWVADWGRAFGSADDARGFCKSTELQTGIPYRYFKVRLYT